MAWPLQSQCDEFYGNPRGTNGRASPRWEVENLTKIEPPFQMTYEGRPIKTIYLHRKCAPSLLKILNSLWKLAGGDQKKIDFWGMSIYGGAYNFRLMRGGNRLSMHAYGCAVDFDPARNGMGNLKGHMSKFPEIINTFEQEGWTWGGRWRGASCDPMHFQAARVG